MDYTFISFILGLSTMFFGIMAVFFWHKGERLHRLVALLMGTIAIEYIKDFIVMEFGSMIDPPVWEAVTSVDMVAVPMYAFVLVELVRPGKLSVRDMLWQELPFVILPVFIIFARWQWCVYVLTVWAGLYGTFYLIWTAVEIPRYNRALRQRFSFTENVNLNWLRVILYTFYVILGIWIFDSLAFNIDMECAYMISNLLLWIVISYFLFRHKSVIDELSDSAPVAVTSSEYTGQDTSLATRIEELFAVQKIFLNPGLKLSDVARAVGSNRTYVSNYFNRDAATSFYDYVNTRRIEYACSLLADVSIPVQEVAERSGFSSPSVFARIFAKYRGCTPSAFRCSLGQ